MIRINITDKAEYSDLRKEFLRRISNYVKFNEEDIVPDQLLGKCADKERKKENLTKETAEQLKNKFENLYKYLFKENSDEVDKKKLQYLLAGPEEMPQSFGGCGEEPTMLACLETIIGACQMPEKADAKEEARKCCEKIFDYKKFVKEQKHAYWLLRKLNVRVCPYCNRMYTVTLPSPEELDKGEEFKTTRATFDHFYGKAEHPYLALSLFNLVPSCSICNSNKSNFKEKFIYPYEQEFGKDAVFRVVPDFSKEARDQDPYILNYLHGESDLFCIKFMGKKNIRITEEVRLEERLSEIDNKELKERIITSIRRFKLEELYKEHKQEIRDVLWNRYCFDEQYVKTVICPMLRMKIKKNSNEISDDAIEKMAMDMLYFNRLRMEEWGQRPLSKLISDILEQLSED